MTILQKMNKSQLEDLGIMQEQLSFALQETELLKTQLLVQEKQARDLVEYNAYLETKQKRTNKRILTMYFTGLGLGLGISGLITYSFGKVYDNHTAKATGVVLMANGFSGFAVAGSAFLWFTFKF